MNLDGLPAPVRIALQSMKEQVVNLRKPRREQVVGVNLMTMKVETTERQIVPNVDLLVDMPDEATVRVYAHCTKPMGEPMLLKSFKNEHVAALRTRVHDAQVSWEEFFSQVVADV